MVAEHAQRPPKPAGTRRRGGPARALAALAATLVGTLPAGAGAAEFAPFGARELDASSPAAFHANYLAEHDAPRIYLTTQCDDDGEDCWKEVHTGAGRELDSFGSEDVVTALARARYRDRAYLFVSQSYECGDSYCTDRYLYRDDGRTRDVPSSYNAGFSGQRLDLTVTRDGALLALTSQALVKAELDGDVARRRAAPGKLTHGRIAASLDGRQAAIATTADDAVWLSDGRDWFDGAIQLGERGDRRGIFGVHPTPNGGVVGVVYRYMNPYNKGLYIARVAPGRETARAGPIFLSTERNVGFDPRVIAADGIRVAAKDSTHDDTVAIRLARDDLGDLPRPPAERFPEGERWASFWVGVGSQLRHWQAHSSVDRNTESAETLADVTYRIDQARLRSYQVQGRLGDTRLTLTYVREQATDRLDSQVAESAADRAGEYLTGSLILPQWNLRLGYRQSSTAGVAEIERASGTTTQSFTTEYKQAGLYVSAERGAFSGLEYTDYSMPTALGFSDSSKTVIAYGFDPQLKLQKVSLVLGYDPEAYAKRYEVNYFDWFVSGKLGGGLGRANLSSDIESRAKTITGEDEINWPLFIAADGTAETGVIWQQRFRRARGLGFQLVAGYQAEGTYMTAGQGEESESVDGLSLEFTRYDFWHGPFLRANAVF